jgi:hypothetical protein
MVEGRRGIFPEPGNKVVGDLVVVRRIATRYDKLARNYLASVCLAARPDGWARNSGWLPLEWGAGDLSHILFSMGSGQWDRQKSAAVPPTRHRIGRHHPGTVGGIISEWRAALSRNGRQVPKNRAPDSAERTGAPHVAQGGWEVVSATLTQIIVSP